MSELEAGDRLVAAYVAIVVGGARFEDERLAVLREAMTADERERAVLALATEVLRCEPVPGRAN
jgi:hypothetical protein